ncbi:MAG: response regulator [Candidatus Riflebacteria bacterium]|nr:response regulator [Candidatus Riflebacteria bacterium]
MDQIKKILIVEDEAILALQMKENLLQMGYSITAIYPSGEEALEGIPAAPPDLVLMDINLLGDIDGIETADRISRQFDIPSIFITAHSEESTITRAKMTGPYGYLLKPVNPKELQIAVEMALYKSKTDKEKAQLTKELRTALEKVKTLSGLLPICCSCKKIRNDKGFWEQVEVYIRDHSEAEFTHSLCGECMKKLYPEIEL